MRFCITLVALFFSFKVSSQTIDTLIKAKASSSTFINSSIYGTATDGHLYSVGLVNQSSNEPIILARIDLTAGSVTYKEIVGSRSSSSAYWTYVFESLGNFYMGLNSNNRKIYKLRLKDSIYIEDLGNGFKNSGALAYSMGLGTDKNIYFGSSSGGTYVSYYNPISHRLIEYPRIQRQGQDYVLTVTGDATHIYAQTGQRDSITLWSIRKNDSTWKVLFKVTFVKE